MILNRRSIDRFNAETVEQVYAIATELGYKSSKEKAYALVRPSDTLIIIICPSLFNPFYTTIIQGIEIAARKQGFVTSVRTTYWDTDTEKFIMEQARKFNVAGVIFAMIPQQPQLAYQLSKYLPVVAIGDRRSDLELATVDMNNFTAGQLIGKHLTDWDINMLPIFRQRSMTNTPHVCAAIRVWRMPARQQMPSFPSSPKRLLLTTSFRTLK